MKTSKDIFSLKGKTAVVTGGMGQLGAEYCLALLSRKAKVAVFDIDIDNPPGKLRKHIRDKKIACFRTDITQKSSIESSLRELKKIFGVPHILINNAAMDSPPDASAEENGPFEHYPEQSWDRIQDVNVKGVFLCCQVIGGQMARLKRGSIINISSVYGMLSPDQRIYSYRQKGKKGFFKPVAYSVSKSAIYNLTRYLSTYWAKSNVRVNTLTLAGVFNNQDKRFLKNYNKKVPLGRMADESEYNGL
jgi:NAD(P)-dependent dehydrogenase (short-subunit alcohol dehydrogenase family)